MKYMAAVTSASQKIFSPPKNTKFCYYFPSNFIFKSTTQLLPREDAIAQGWCQRRKAMRGQGSTRQYHHSSSSPSLPPSHPWEFKRIFRMSKFWGTKICIVIHEDLFLATDWSETGVLKESLFSKYWWFIASSTIKLSSTSWPFRFGTELKVLA